MVTTESAKTFVMVLMEAWIVAPSGESQSHSQWKLTLAEDFELETVSYTARNVKKVLAKLGDLPERLLCEQDTGGVIHWQQMLSKYLEIKALAFYMKFFWMKVWKSLKTSWINSFT